MTFEEFMMVRNHAWRRDVAITDKIGPTTTTGTLIVRFGQRGRIGETTKAARTLCGGRNRTVGRSDGSRSTGTPIPMRAGDSASNLIVPAPPGGLAAPLALRSPLDFATDRALLMRSLTGNRGALDAERALAKTSSDE